MKRRSVLRYTVYTMTGAAIYPLIEGCQSAASSGDFTPSHFETDTYNTIIGISDALLPETDTPGAVSLGVPQFCDHMIGKVFPPEQSKNFTTDLGKLAAFLDSKSDGGSFAALADEKKKELITQLDKEWHADASNVTDEKAAYLGLRGQVISYYLATEYVGTNLLNYLPVPGEYVPCTTLEEVGGKSWTI